MHDQAAMFPELSPMEQAFLLIIREHRGAVNAIGLPDMAQKLGLGRGKNGQRIAQKIKKHLVEEHAVPVGSSCGEHHGWYTPETAQEIADTIGQYESRLRSLSVLIARTKRCTPAELLRQQAIQFEQEAIPA